MKCPKGLHWIPDREFCSRCEPGYIWNAEFHECTKMDRSVISPGKYHTAAAALFGFDGEKHSKIPFLLLILALFVILGS